MNQTACSSSARLPDVFVEKLNERLRNGTVDVPILPDVAAEIMSKPFNEDSDVRELSNLIHRDPMMAGQVLKVANSAAFGGKSTIVSLQQAVVRLGLQTLREIVVAVAFKSQIFSVKEYEQEMRLFWNAAAAAGGSAREIARALRKNVESAFLCGLLHNVGQPVAMLELIRLQRQLRNELPKDVLLGAIPSFETPITQLVVDKWALPELIRNAVLYYRKYEQLEADPLFAQIVCLAEVMGHYILETSPENAERVRIHPACALLNLYPEDLDTLLEKREIILAFVESVA